MQYEISVDIDAARAHVWDVLTDVERWPEWTPSMTRLQRLDSGPFGVGSRVRVKQPRFPAMVWEVTALEPERSFSWAASSGGVTTVADHRLADGPGGRVTVAHSIRQVGLLAPVVALLSGARTRRYVHMEAQGLKRRCEAG